MKNKHNCSRCNIQAVLLLGKLVRIARKQNKMTTLELSERAGISRGLLQRIEKGDPKCSIGAVFEVATIVGVKLFDANENALNNHIYQIEEKLTLLPKSIHRKRKELKDEF